MFNTYLHSIIKKSLKNFIFINEKSNEDDFRSSFIIELKKHLPNVDIITPSTRSADGDIKILNKKIEIKFKNFTSNNLVPMGEVIEDFDSVVHGKTDFFMIAFQFKYEESNSTNFHKYINFHELKNTYSGNGTKYTYRSQKKSIGYKAYSIFLGGCFIEKPRLVKLDSSKKNGINSYVSFEHMSNIRKEYFLEVSDDMYIHANVIGSPEDGIIYFLYSRAEGIIFHKKKIGDIGFTHKNTKYFFANEFRARYTFRTQKTSLNNMNINYRSERVYLYKIYN